MPHTVGHGSLADGMLRPQFKEEVCLCRKTFAGHSTLAQAEGLSACTVDSCEIASSIFFGGKASSRFQCKNGFLLNRVLCAHLVNFEYART